MKEFIEVLLKVCTVASIGVIFIPMTNVISVKWFALLIIIALVIIFWLITIILEKKEVITKTDETVIEKSADDDKVYITDIKVDCNGTIIYFQKNQRYHVDALVCIYKDAIPDAELIGIGEVGFCENNYTTVKVIRIIDKKSFEKFITNRKEMDGKIFVITSFKRSYIKFLNNK